MEALRRIVIKIVIKEQYQDLYLYENNLGNREVHECHVVSQSQK